MPVKTTGAEWKRFYADAEFWPEDAWHEDQEIVVNGEPEGDDIDLDDIPDTAVLSISGGIVYLPNSEKEPPSLETHFKRWRKKQSNATLIITFPKERMAEVEDLLKKNDVKVGLIYIP